MTVILHPPVVRISNRLAMLCFDCVDVATMRQDSCVTLVCASGILVHNATAVSWLAPESGKVCRCSAGDGYGCAVRSLESGEASGSDVLQRGVLRSVELSLTGIVQRCSLRGGRCRARDYLPLAHGGARFCSCGRWPACGSRCRRRGDLSPWRPAHY